MILCDTVKTQHTFLAFCLIGLSNTAIDILFLQVSSSDSAHATVVVAIETTLSSPDTQSYLDKMDKEKKARQHGAESDNRSFLAKYVSLFP